MTGFVARDGLRAALEDRGHAVVEEGDVLVLPVPWNEREAGRVELHWEGAEGRVRLRVPLPLRVAGETEAAVAAAISAANREINLVALRREGDGIVVALFEYLEPDGRLSSRVVERLVAMGRVIALSYRDRLERAAAGRAAPRRLHGTPRIAERVLSIDRSLGAEVASAGVRATRVRDFVELVQPWLSGHAVLEVRLDGGVAVQLARGPDGGLTLLTGHLEAWNRLVADEGGLRFDDEAAVLAYALHAGHWARPRVAERRVEAWPRHARVGPPAVQLGARGAEVVVWVESDGKLVRRTILVRGDGTLEVRDAEA